MARQATARGAHGRFPSTGGQGAPVAVLAGATAAVLPAGATGTSVHQLECGKASGHTRGSLFSARARQETWVHGRALPHAWGTVVRALSGDGTGSCQLLPVRAHGPPHGSRSTNGPGIVRHATGHAEAVAGGAGLHGHRHAWLATAGV